MDFPIKNKVIFHSDVCQRVISVPDLCRSLKKMVLSSNSKDYVDDLLHYGTSEDLNSWVTGW